MSETIVVNVKYEDCDVYIGRWNPRFRIESPFANPYHVGPDGTRAEVIAKYEEMMREKLSKDPELLAKLLAMKGKRLGCWCAPKACHGDVLVEFIEEFDN